MLRTRNGASSGLATKDQQLALRKCLLFMAAFRAVRRIMPMQYAYAFLLVALEEGRGVQEYAERAGVTQAVMTRILFALGSSSRGRERGYGLVQQAIDPEDARKHQTFLSAKGKALMREIVRLVRSDRPSVMNPRNRDMAIALKSSPGEMAHSQWLLRLVGAGQKLDPKDLKLAVQIMTRL